VGLCAFTVPLTLLKMSQRSPDSPGRSLHGRADTAPRCLPSAWWVWSPCPPSEPLEPVVACRVWPFYLSQGLQAEVAIPEILWYNG
jgi:hypothetical protein